MNTGVRLLVTQLFVLLLSGSLVLAQQDGSPDLESTLEQERSSLDVPIPQQPAPKQNRPVFTQQELDQMLAPIALYPDALLSQILMAATYPLEVVEAARWSKANPNLKGDEAVRAVAQRAWDPSVKSLVAFPQILLMMDEKLIWMERLGDAFLSQQAQVMDTVQQLRQKASAAGNLSSNDQIRVNQQGQSIVIEPANPQVVYVPYYDPMVIYGPWWWPAYPPVYWAPWPGYFYGPRFGVGVAWGFGIGIGSGFFFGGFNWPYHHVTVVNVNNFYYQPRVFPGVTGWVHDPIHRRGVPYRDLALREQFGRTIASPEGRREFRGHESASFEARGGLGIRPEARPGLGTRSQGQSGSPGRLTMPGGSRSDSRSAPSYLDVPRAFTPRSEPRPHAFEGIGQGGAVRNFSARGQSSVQGFSYSPGFGSRPFGGFHGGGASGFRGGGGGGHHR